MSVSSGYQPVAADFLPLAQAATGAQISRPSLSYWQDAWRRLKQNPRAMLSLLVVAFMIAGTLVGPLLWRVNPAHQVLDQISQGPNLGMSALLVDDYVPWAGRTVTVSPTRAATAADLAAPSAITVHGQPTTEAVRFHWTPVAGATGYAIYRHELPPGGSFDLGLPLGEGEGAGTVSFEDRLGPVSYTHLRAHETVLALVCRLLLEKKKTLITHDIRTTNTRTANGDMERPVVSRRHVNTITTTM